MEEMLNGVEAQCDWFESWFNSPYYHVLYKERDHREAEQFLDILIKFLNPVAGARILDVACGKGRHALYLNKLGFDVTGYDLSSESIAYDKQFENDHLSFYLHDMRETSWVNCFDYAFSLFTSFGYFDREHDNIKAIKAQGAALKEGGMLVLDYMNADRVLKQLPMEEKKEVDGIAFEIKKYVEDHCVVKDIYFTANDAPMHFHEQLQIIRLPDFENYFSQCRLSLQHVFGDYALNPYDPQQSERLILIARKEKA